MAGEVVVSVATRSPVSAGIRTAVIDVGLTVNALKAWGALTGIAVDSVNAGASV